MIKMLYLCPRCREFVLETTHCGVRTILAGRVIDGEPHLTGRHMRTWSPAEREKIKDRLINQYGGENA